MILVLDPLKAPQRLFHCLMSEQHMFVKVSLSLAWCQCVVLLVAPQSYTKCISAYWITTRPCFIRHDSSLFECLVKTGIFKFL